MAKLKDKIQNALDESRMLVLGSQVLLGFQYRSAFEPGFEKLPVLTQYLKMGGLCLLLVALGLLLSPAAHHRIVEEGEASRVLNAPLHPYTQALIAAIPSADPAARRNSFVLKGDLPSPDNIPEGCRFHPRCPKVMEICRREHPVVTYHPGGVSVECHLY